MNPKIIAVSALALALALPYANGARADAIENLERERAIMIATFLDPSLLAEEREMRVATSKHRLVDLERMVLRDGSIMGKSTPIVRKAFESYDLTFLIHASTELGRSAFDHWLEQIGVSSHSLATARMGRR